MPRAGNSRAEKKCCWKRLFRSTLHRPYQKRGIKSSGRLIQDHLAEDRSSSAMQTAFWRAGQKREHTGALLLGRTSALTVIFCRVFPTVTPEKARLMLHVDTVKNPCFSAFRLLSRLKR